jgi:hypothetical protein
MKVSLIDILLSNNPKPKKKVRESLISFLHTRLCRDIKKIFKLNSIFWIFCKEDEDEDDNLAYYVMTTKKNPQIILHDAALYRFAKSYKLSIKNVVYFAMLHEMTHAYLDCKGLNKHSERTIDKFAFKVLRTSVKEAMPILDKYLKGKKK